MQTDSTTTPIQLLLPLPPSYKRLVPKFQCRGCGSVHYTKDEVISCQQASR